MRNEQPDGMDARLGEALRAMAEEETLTSHPGAEELAAYSEGRLPPDQEDCVQDHLACCRDCAAQVVDVALLRAAGASAETTTAELSDAEAEALWRTMRPLDWGRGTPSTGSARWWPTPPWVPAVAASFLIVVLGLSAWVLDLRRTLGEFSGPQLNTPVEVLVPASFLRGAQERWKVIELPAGAESLTLVLSLSERARFDGYSLEIVAGDEVRWQGRGLVRNAEGSFTVTLSRAWLSPGRCHFRLFGYERTEQHLLATYPVEIRQPSEGGS